MKDIQKILYTYSINNKILDEKAIKYITNMIILILNLDSHIKRINIIKSKDKTFYEILGAYLYEEKELVLNLNEYQYLFETNSLIPEYVSEEKSNITDAYFVINSNIIKTIIHECNHARQRKNYDLSINKSIDNQIINKEIDYFFENGLKGYKKISRNSEFSKYYKYELSERLAEINALRTVRNLLKNIKEGKNAKDINELFLYETYFNGYERRIKGYLSPTSKIIKIMKENIELPKDKSFMSRIILGLDITKEEYKELENNFTEHQKKLL